MMRSQVGRTQESHQPDQLPGNPSYNTPVGQQMLPGAHHAIQHSAQHSVPLSNQPVGYQAPQPLNQRAQVGSGQGRGNPFPNCPLPGQPQPQPQGHSPYGRGQPLHGRASYEPPGLPQWRRPF